MNKKNVIITVIAIIAVISALLGAIFLVMRNINHSNGKSLTVYFVRHAQTDANVEGLLVGSETDAMLTEEGRTQAERAGEYLAGISFDKSCTSEASRTQETADIILDRNQYAHPRNMQMALLNDVNWGSVAGLTPNEAHNRFPDIADDNYLGDVNDASFVSPVGATTKYNKVREYKQAMDIMADDSSDGSNILVVGHSSYQWYLQTLDPNLPESTIPNASITILKYYNGEWHIQQYATIP